MLFPVYHIWLQQPYRRCWWLPGTIVRTKYLRHLQDTHKIQRLQKRHQGMSSALSMNGFIYFLNTLTKWYFELYLFLWITLCPLIRKLSQHRTTSLWPLAGRIEIQIDVCFYTCYVPCTCCSQMSKPFNYQVWQRCAIEICFPGVEEASPSAWWGGKYWKIVDILTWHFLYHVAKYRYFLYCFI